MEKEITFKIVEHIGVLRGKEPSGWRRELNLVSWNDRPAKYDIRDWTSEHDKCSHGITFSADEMEKIVAWMNERKEKNNG